jgi:hypothetical protein
LWDDLAVNTVELDHVRNLSILAIEQLRLIRENFLLPSEKIHRKQCGLTSLMKEESLKYERLMNAIRETKFRIMERGGGQLSPRVKSSLARGRPVSFFGTNSAGPSTPASTGTSPSNM